MDVLGDIVIDNATGASSFKAKPGCDAVHSDKVESGIGLEVWKPRERFTMKPVCMLDLVQRPYLQSGEDGSSPRDGDTRGGLDAEVSDLQVISHQCKSQRSCRTKADLREI